jgi:hypothetical protein
MPVVQPRHSQRMDGLSLLSLMQPTWLHQTAMANPTSLSVIGQQTRPISSAVPLTTIIREMEPAIILQFQQMDGMWPFPLSPATW